MFYVAEELYFSPINCINCFNLVICAMTCNGAPYRCLLEQKADSPGFRTDLKRTDTCMQADLERQNCNRQYQTC
ncbi:hypothetical protein SADUNF_Sadunf06G0130600 [Salix dunnii]|uniref:Uncharacterized protein n=1 Tax=Salix dunnii TaxID=1413687 RepID=A0A835N0T1_9ROSI|nr:hypothetical protein SADUNF_Sadunf06G0130600 [Salix dunnii]